MISDFLTPLVPKIQYPFKPNIHWIGFRENSEETFIVEQNEMVSSRSSLKKNIGMNHEIHNMS